MTDGTDVTDRPVRTLKAGLAALASQRGRSGSPAGTGPVAGGPAEGDRFPGVVPIDPRLQARRVAVHHEVVLRRSRRLAVLVMLLALVAAGFAVTYSPGLAVARIDVRGAEGVRLVEVMATAGVEVGDPLVWTDGDEVARRLRDLAWVAAAEVHKNYPRGLAIEVRERRAVASVTGSDGQTRLVDVSGTVLGPAVPAGPVVALEGVAPVNHPGAVLDGSWADVLAVAASLPPSLLLRAVSLGQAPSGPELRLSEGGVVRLRDAEDLSEKYLAALAVLAQVGPEEVAVLDVGVPDAPVLTRNPR